MKAQDHWEKVYREEDPTTGVSWYQAEPAMSLQFILAAGVEPNQPVIDVGGGASLLVDRLLAAGFGDLTVLDISGAALEHAQKRLGARASAITWTQSDVTVFKPARSYALWHDRAVFHFLTGSAERAQYLSVLRGALPPGGHLILGTFAEDGPVRCSGLPVMRYDARAICAELGSEFALIEQQRERHFTPWKTEQKFNWFRFQRRSPASNSTTFPRVNQPADKPAPAR